jgi:hypothetical protein
VLRAFVCALVAVSPCLPQVDQATNDRSSIPVLTFSSRPAQFQASSGGRRIENTKQRSTSDASILFVEIRSAGVSRCRGCATCDSARIASTSCAGVHTGRSPPLTVS